MDLQEFKVGTAIKIELPKHLSHWYTAVDVTDKALKLKLSPHEVLPYSNHASFWLPKAALVKVDTNYYRVKNWFFKTATRAQILSLGGKI